MLKLTLMRVGEVLVRVVEVVVRVVCGGEGTGRVVGSQEC
jgi:hypothetical protein